MTSEEQKKFISFMVRMETKTNRIETKVDSLIDLFIMHLGDAQHVSDLQRQLKDANEKIRELETELYMEGKRK